MATDEYIWNNMSELASLSEHYSREDEICDKIKTLQKTLELLDPGDTRDLCEEHIQRLESMLKRTTKIIKNLRNEVDDSEIGAGEGSDTSGFRRLPAITDRNPEQPPPTV